MYAMNRCGPATSLAAHRETGQSLVIQSVWVFAVLHCPHKRDIIARFPLSSIAAAWPSMNSRTRVSSHADHTQHHRPLSRMRAIGLRWNIARLLWRWRRRRRTRYLSTYRRADSRRHTPVGAALDVLLCIQLLIELLAVHLPRGFSRRPTPPFVCSCMDDQTSLARCATDALIIIDEGFERRDEYCTLCTHRIYQVTSSTLSADRKFVVVMLQAKITNCRR
jgi:hypothetical protein